MMTEQGDDGSGIKSKADWESNPSWDSRSVVTRPVYLTTGCPVYSEETQCMALPSFCTICDNNNQRDTRGQSGEEEEL